VPGNEPFVAVELEDLQEVPSGRVRKEVIVDVRVPLVRIFVGPVRWWRLAEPTGRLLVQGRSRGCSASRRQTIEQ
jgi:hypothetical protein